MKSLFRIVEIRIDREEIFRSMMAEYALISAGKSAEADVPMQYARCDFEKIFYVIFNQEVGKLCSSMLGYVADCRPHGETMMSIIVKLPLSINSVGISALRRRMESYLISAGLERCLLSVSSASVEAANMAKRSQASLRSIRQMLCRAK